MIRYKIIIEYDGTNYVGWQKQDNGPSIQEAIESCGSRFARANYFPALETGFSSGHPSDRSDLNVVGFAFANDSKPYGRR